MRANTVNRKEAVATEFDNAKEPTPCGLSVDTAAKSDPKFPVEPETTRTDSFDQKGADEAALQVRVDSENQRVAGAMELPLRQRGEELHATENPEPRTETPALPDPGKLDLAVIARA